MDIKQIAMNYDRVTFLACNNIQQDLAELSSFDIEVSAIDYDPKFKNIEHYVNKDFVFDDVDLTADLIVHMNCEKTYPVKLSSDVILRGDNENHNGDCCPITSCEQLIEMYNLKEVYQQEITSQRKTFLNGISHFFVYGRA